ncbi:AraC family transcriptional regulator [Paenibacillus spongiae]|uniref:AraC family transcriptional regulator n=1 Tax=Paenibacillus spongiae TaxID=2909671 RepID=A0ABY5S7S7_9BACL|nr:AraC family transcriptional regulator [Paenibacillus spongiae]UVI28887.1 AraC family transcriptional regulator [Paenibacillus spongiae]
MNWQESASRLNRHAFRPAAADAVFTVHGWGMHQCHYSNPPHKHSFFEICYVLDGEGTYVDDGKSNPLHSGTLFCSRPGIPHQILSESGMELVFVAFELDEHASADNHRKAFLELMKTEKVCVYDGDELPSALLWKSLFLLADYKGAVPAAALPAASAALLLSFPDLFGEAVRRQHPAPRRNSAHTLKQAKLFIADNLSDNDLSLGKVAGYLNMSERHLSRMFSSGIHESFTDYVRRIRVQQAADLLMQTDLPIAAIAEQTGFGSVHYFSRTFHTLMNETPAQFRENAVNGTKFI